MNDLDLVNLQDNLDLKTLHFENEEDWLELRTKGIGGSDIGAIMGLNKYSSPLKIYKQKIEGYKEDMSDNAYVKKGKDLEDLILQNYVIPEMAKSGYTVIKPSFMIINNNYSYLRANVDGIAFKYGTPSSENIIIEIKWVSEYAEVNWNGPEYNGVPASYYAQVQLYMLVTGARLAKVCALFDKDWTMHYYDIPRDEMFILQLKHIAEKFYNYNMYTRIPPMMNTELDKEDVVKAIKKEVYSPVSPSTDLTTFIEKYLEISKQIKELEKDQSECKDMIFDLYRKGFYADNSKHSVRCITTSAHRFNATRFKLEHPDLYEEYCEDSESSRFTIK